MTAGIPLRASLLAPLALGACVGACGTQSRSASSLADVSNRAQPLGDEDRDTPRPSAYLDGDDGAIRDFGHAASAQEARAIAVLVGRYYAAARAADGARACALMFYILRESVPERYGRPPGPRYLAGLHTCPAVLGRVFARFHAQLATPPTVTAVRVEGKQAYALLGWSALPAGYIEARRLAPGEGRAWKIDAPLAVSLP
jgi:hypothetical protein